MEFGRVAEEELNKTDFSLPKEPAANKSILKGKPVKDPKIYIGCAKWDRQEWIGKIYPPKTKEKDFLQHYIEHYNSVELNATHYKVHGVAVSADGRRKQRAKIFCFVRKCIKE
jgi:hypothetical protein